MTFATAAALLAASAGVAQETSYHLEEAWAELPPGVDAWGQTIGVEMDADGSLWVFHRCFAQICTGRDDVAPVLRYDPSGRLVESWGEGMFVWPHGFTLDAAGNLWTTDARGAGGIGHTVMKLDRDGRVLMTLGTPGVAGAGQDTFDGPADVAVAPNGDIFVADGHGNDRIVKFSPAGDYVMEWGEEGTDYGQFNEPHTLAFDSRGRLFVGDRINQRIQVFDQNGRFLAVWPAIMASGMHITPDDVVYVADYQLRQGVVIARASDFAEIGFVDDAMGEGVTVDAARNVYVAEVLPRNLKRFTRRTLR
jgi:sugar lactone lactonase YvrE